MLVMHRNCGGFSLFLNWSVAAFVAFLLVLAAHLCWRSPSSATTKEKMSAARSQDVRGHNGAYLLRLVSFDFGKDLQG